MIYYEWETMVHPPSPFNPRPSGNIIIIKMVTLFLLNEKELCEQPNKYEKKAECP